MVRKFFDQFAIEGPGRVQIAGLKRCLGGDVVHVGHERAVRIAPEEFIGVRQSALVFTFGKRRERGHVERLLGKLRIMMILGDACVCRSRFAAPLGQFVKCIGAIHFELYGERLRAISFKRRLDNLERIGGPLFLQPTPSDPMGRFGVVFTTAGQERPEMRTSVRRATRQIGTLAGGEPCGTKMFGLGKPSR